MTAKFLRSTLARARAGAPGISTAGTGYELNAIDNGGNLLAVNAFHLQIIIGALSLIAVAFDQPQCRAK